MFRLSAAVAAILCCVTAVPAFAALSRDQEFRAATPEELAMKSVAWAPGVPAAVLDWVRYDDHPTSSYSEYVRIKVFTDEGKKYGDVSVPYVATYPFFGFVTNIDARTIHADGTIVPFDGKVFDKLLFKKGRGVIRAKTFSLADVQPGSILEYHYVSRWSEQLVVGAEWVMQKDIPVEHVKFSLLPFSRKFMDYGTFFTYSALPPGKLPQKVTQDKWELQLEHIPAFPEEAYTLPEEQVKPRVRFYYTESRVRPDQFWDVQAHQWQKEIDAFLRSRKASAAVESLIAGESDPMLKLRKVYDHVQSYANRSVGAAPAAVRSVREAHNADEVIQDHAGVATDLTRTFVALARAAGFDADVARVAPRDETFFSDKIPDADQMSGEVAVVTIGGKPFYFDPGTPGAPFGVLSWEKTYVPTIRMTKSAGPQWTKTPADPPSAAMLQRKADLHFDGDTLAGSLTVLFRGQEALVRRQRGEDEKARRNEIESEIKGWFPNGATLKVDRIDGLASDSDAITIDAHVQLPGIVSAAGSRLMMPLSLFAASAKNPFAPATRQYAIYFPYSRQEDDEVKLTLPEKATAANVPAPQALNAGAFTYNAVTMQKENVLTFHRTLVIDAMFFDVDQYSAVRSFFTNAVAADQRPLVLRMGAE